MNTPLPPHTFIQKQQNTNCKKYFIKTSKIAEFLETNTEVVDEKFCNELCMNH